MRQAIFRLTGGTLLDEAFLTRFACPSTGEAIPMDAHLSRVSTHSASDRCMRKVESGIMNKIPCPSYIEQARSPPHAIASRAGHHLANETMLNAEFGEYLYRSTCHATLRAGPAIAL